MDEPLISSCSATEDVNNDPQKRNVSTNLLGIIGFSRQTSKDVFRKHFSQEKNINFYQKRIIERPRRQSSINDLHLELEKEVPVAQKWKDLAGDFLVYINPSKYNQLESIFEKQQFSNNENRIIFQIIPYVLQKIKMWGCNILTAQKLNDMLPYDDNDDFQFINDAECLQVLNKLDIFSCLVASTDPVVLSEIFRILSKFPIALPLVLPDVTANKQNWILLASLFQNCLIKWEKEEKQVSENLLFKTPYKMITAIRLGNASSNGIGKSTFLNQLFSTFHVFQCKGQPGGDRGKAKSLEGSVEFIWLTKDTCRETIWDAIQVEMKDCKEGELVLLANLHGNALDYREVVQSLSPMTSTFIAFVMGDHTLNPKEITSICGTENILTLYIDRTQPIQKKSLNSMDIMDDNKTLRILKSLLKQAINKSKTKNKPNLFSTISVKCMEEIKTKKSEEFINNVFALSSGTNYDNLLKLQKISGGNVGSYFEEWKKSHAIQDLMEKFVKIFTLPLNERRPALAHIERELSIFSNKKANEAAIDLPKLMEERKNITACSNKSTIELDTINSKITSIYKRMAQSLTIEDFLRELSMIYETMMWFQVKFHTSLYARLPERYADMLIEGMPLEIFNGDKESVPDIWLDAVCHSICSKMPDMKIFVVSILGLQSTGKSTLLNAMFGCKFATSVGKCTRGLYMRLIPLQEKYRQSLKFDALLIIDTEGLGSPQTMLDPNSQSKDREMATFAMSISDLTLINVSGEVYQNIVDILQIVIIIIAGMDESDICPDILLVQQITDIGQGNKLSEGVDKFCDALNEAVTIIKTQGMVLGVTAENNLTILKERIMKKEILCQLSPFKKGASPQAPPTEEYHNDVVHLRTRILTEYYSRTTANKYFCSWHKLLKRYWLAVKEKEFSKFKSIKQVQDFIEVTTRMASVKSAFSEVLLSHQEVIKEYILEDIRDSSKSKLGKDDNKVRKSIYAQLQHLPDDCGKYAPNKQPGNEPCVPCCVTKYSQAELLEFVSQNPTATLNDTKESINSFFNHSKEASVAKMYKLYLSLKHQLETPLQFDETLNEIIAEQDLSPTGKSADDIWQELNRRIEYQHPLKCILNEVVEKILQECKDFKSIGKLKGILDGADKNPSLPLHNAKKKVKFYYTAKRDIALTENEHQFLIDRIKGAAKSNVEILKQQNKLFLPNNVHLYRKSVTEIFDSFQKTYNPFQLQGAFKESSTCYSFQVYVLHMIDWQEEWNQKNHELYLLRKMEPDYFQKIRSYIRPDVSTKVSNLAELIVGKILDAAKSVSINLTFSEIINDFKKWELGPEKIRIKYLLTLAEKMCGNYDKSLVVEEALNYFSNPGRELENWYLKWIDGHVQTDLESLVKKIFESECQEIVSKVEAIKTNDELSRFVNWYLLQIEEVYMYHKFTDNEYSVLQKEILCQLSKRKNIYRDKITIENLRHYYNSLLDVLGCTATCPGCGAICYGPKDHEKNMIPYKYHFTCHQPMGLSGKVNEESQELEVLSCDLDDNDGSDLTNWMKSKHTVEEYSLIMQWFFLRLNYPLAKKYNVTAAQASTLKSNGLNTLEMRKEKFLFVIQNKM